MNNQIFHKTWFTIFFLASVLWLNAQSIPEVKASVDHDSILIGEPIRLTLEADIPENSPIRFFPVDTIPHFEFLDRGKIDTSNTSEGTFLRRVMVITSFDSGHWVIPQLTIGDGIVTDSIAIDVGYSEFDRSQDYHDIKEILEVKPAEKKTPWWWYAIGAGLIILLIIFIIVLRKKKPKVAAVEVPIDPYADAMNELTKLRASQLDQKQYYSYLVNIFRLYISRKKGIHSLQKTTDDLVIQLKGIGMNKDSFEKLSQALRLSDYVKFAKYVPGKEDDAITFDSVKKSIEEIEQIK
jgi:hypothetical protein